MQNIFNRNLPMLILNKRNFSNSNFILCFAITIAMTLKYIKSSRILTFDSDSDIQFQRVYLNKALHTTYTIVKPHNTI